MNQSEQFSNRKNSSLKTNMSTNRDSSSKQIALLHVSSSKDKNNNFLAAVFKSMGSKSQTTCQIEIIFGRDQHQNNKFIFKVSS